MKFESIIGQEKVKQQLIQSVKNGRISHAQLFLGPEGSGALPLAIAYAQYINCHNPTDTDSCGVCRSCINIQKFHHPDLHFSFPIIVNKTAKKEICDDYYPNWLQALPEKPYITYYEWMLNLDEEGKKQGNIPAGECRQMIKKLGLKAFDAKYKVLIIWLPEYLGQEGNILLKQLEEPSPNTLIILVSENSERILGTILSRTQILKIPRLSDQDIINDLVTNQKIDLTQAEPIARLAEGNLAAARQMAAEGVSNFHGYFVNWMRATYTNKMLEIAPIAEQINDQGREFAKRFLLYSLQMFRAVSLYKYAAMNMIKLSSEELVFIEKFQTVFQADVIHDIVSETNDTIYALERNGDIKLIFYNLSFYISRRLGTTTPTKV
jgi:DNA polymerase-3 subunit delta'